MTVIEKWGDFIKDIASQIAKLSYRQTVIVLLFLFMGAYAQNLGESRIVEESIENAASELRNLIGSQIEVAGGNLETQHVHLIFGFSTGHFGFDPVRAQAARSLAWELLDTTLVKNDTLSVYAFEMDIWNHTETAGTPITISADDPTSKESLKSLLPLAPQANSTGGHDTELAIGHIFNNTEDKSRSIIVLFTNRAASITKSPETQPLIGSNDPSYQEALKNFTRLESINPTGASFEPSYEVVLEDGTTVSHTFDVVVLVPKSFQSEALMDGTRSSKLMASLQIPDSSDRTQNRSIFFILVFVILGIGAFLLLRRGRTSVLGNDLYLTVHGHKFDFTSAKQSEIICYLVGPKYIEVYGTDPKAVIVTNPALPSEKLAQFKKRKSKVVIEDGLLSLVSINGEMVSAPFTLENNEENTVEFQGQIKQNPAMPPTNVPIRVTIRLGV